MFKRAIAVTAATILILTIPAAEVRTEGEAVPANNRQIASKLKTEVENLKTKKAEPIRPKEVKNYDTRRNESNVEPDAGGHEAEDNGNSSGGADPEEVHTGQLPDSAGGDPDPSGDVLGEAVGTDTEPEQVYEEVFGASGDGNEEAGEDSGEDVEPEWEYYCTARITHYCTGPCCCGEWAGGLTASEAEPIPYWTVANGALPFGTHVLIDGAEYCVTDRGVGGDQFDILVGSHDEAMERGMFYTDVYVRW
jgi:hypothetical protein